MWNVDNKTPYAAAGNWVRDHAGAEVWIVAVKATYDLHANGTLTTAREQEPVFTAAQPYLGRTSLWRDADLCAPRPATDVLLTGHAHAPTGKGVQELGIAWRVGPIKRTARIFGDRHWTSGLFGATPSVPERFVRMPLSWERAMAHEDFNPVGCGIAPDLDRRVRLPNIENVQNTISSKSSRPAPVGFGPIASHWEPRRGFSGTFDEAWQRDRSPLLPVDMDARHWQAAPVHQQVAPHLRGGESAALLNLTPPGFGKAGRVDFVLPRVSLAFETRFYDGGSVLSRSVIHTVLIDTDAPRVIVVHHMNLSCHSRVNQLDCTIVREKSRPLDRPHAPGESDASFEEAQRT